MDRLGKDRNPFRAGFLQFVGVAETREEALELYAEPALYFYERSLHVDSRFAAPPGYASEATLRARVKSQVAQAAAKATEERASGQRTAFEDIVEKGYVIIGSADEVAEQLREVAVNLNIGQMMLLLQFGNMSKDLAFFNTELFAKKVAPQLKGLFESEWENRWWPKPLPAASRASARELRR
jgi:alkanesulfonate monooxygenase SsuD/methylene tetrahydromethanopterin reductase-like flavin-dependent oxidoreductase (luciferase family)